MGYYVPLLVSLSAINLIFLAYIFASTAADWFVHHLLVPNLDQGKDAFVDITMAENMHFKAYLWSHIAGDIWIYCIFV